MGRALAGNRRRLPRRERTVRTMREINRLISGYNHNAGDVSRIKYIVIHYTGALGDARANCNYFAGGDRKASAHYFVGYGGEIWQSVEDKNIAWHCGAKSYKHAECRNANSIGIEMCVRKKSTASMGATDKDWYFEDATVEAAAELTRHLMEKYGVPASHVIRHYDVTGKICPNPYVYNTTAHTWEKFKQMIGGAASAGSSQTAAAGGIAQNTDTERAIWYYLAGRGLNAYAVAGLMGNLYAESGLNPCNLQNSYNKSLDMTDAQYTAAVDNGSYGNFAKDKAGYGLAQWTYHTRKQALLDYARKAGASIGSLDMQLAFLWDELQGYKSVISALKGAGSVRAASDAVLLGFEKPADQSGAVQKRRAEYGEAYYKKYAGGQQAAAPQEKPQAAGVPFKVRVDAADLRIRTGAGTGYAFTGEYTGKGVFTITEVKEGRGSNAGWGRLKSGAGWISLDYATRLA